MSGVTARGIRYPDGATKAKDLGDELKTMADDLDVEVGKIGTSLDTRFTQKSASIDVYVAAHAVEGKRGPQGLPGAETLPTDDAVAAYISTEGDSATKAALTAALAPSIARASALGGAAAERLFAKLRQGTADASVVVIGDSTGDAIYRWPREYAIKLAANFPQWRVNFASWNNANRAYGATEQIQAGTNGRTVTLWNASVSGGSSYTHQAPDAGPMYVTKEPDLIFVNDGHNEGSPAWTGSNTRWSFHARYAALCEDVRRRSPEAGIVLVGQNPPLAGVPHMVEKTNVIKNLAAMRGYGFADTTQAFIDAGLSPTLYESDMLHPNAAGGKLQAATIWAATFMAAPANPAASLTSSYTDPPAVNMLANGEFTDLAPTTNLPASWAATNANLSKDVANYENAKRGYGFRISSKVAGSQSFIYQVVLTAAQIAPWRGRYVTYLVRLRNNLAASKTTAGRIALLDGVQNVDGITDPWSHSGFVWRAVTLRIADTATQLQARIYADYGVDGLPDVTVDGAWLVEGITPRKAT